MPERSWVTTTRSHPYLHPTQEKSDNEAPEVERERQRKPGDSNTMLGLSEHALVSNQAHAPA